MLWLREALIRTILVLFTFLIKLTMFLNAVLESFLSVSFALLQIIKKSFFVRLRTSSFSLQIGSCLDCLLALYMWLFMLNQLLQMACGVEFMLTTVVMVILAMLSHHIIPLQSLF
jgi:hypothetical protein